MKHIHTNHRRIKVLHMIDHLGIGGAQNMAVNLLENFGPDIEASLCILTDRLLPSLVERLRSAGIKFQSLGLSKFNPLGLYHLRRAIQKASPDILHTHLQYSSIYGVAAAFSLGGSRPVVVDHIHSNPFKIYTLFQRTACRVLAPAVKVQITVSSDLKSPVRSAFKKHAAGIRIIPPGLNLKNFECENDNASDVSNLRKGAKRVVGMVGRLVKEKSFHIFLAAAPSLLADEPDTRMLIVGEGPLLETLKSLAKNLGISQAVTFTGYRRDISSVYKAMDVFVLPSLAEGCSLAMIEAMLSGVPVVVTDVEGVRDMVVNGETGLVIPFNDSGALSTAIIKLFNESGLRQQLAIKASAAARKTYDATRMAKEIESLYKEMAFHKFNKYM
jgi:glycosyltransferase involved in cell wall biosynthesis